MPTATGAAHQSRRASRDRRGRGPHARIDVAFVEDDRAEPAPLRQRRRGVLRPDLALHKSVRGSNPDAALYWICRMLDGGADPLYVGRRLSMASEDIGLADPRALRLALEASRPMSGWGRRKASWPRRGSGLSRLRGQIECSIRRVQRGARFVAEDGSRPVPFQLRNAPTKLMKDLGYGKAYRYAHDEADAYAAGEHYFPEGMRPVSWYEPTDRGLEAKIARGSNRCVRGTRRRRTTASSVHRTSPCRSELVFRLHPEIPSLAILLGQTEQDPRVPDDRSARRPGCICRIRQGPADGFAR